MKHKNLKLKKACFILGASFVLYAYLKTDHVYNPKYEIVENEDYYATYSLGKIYIVKRKEVNSIINKLNKNIHSIFLLYNFLNKFNWY